MSQDIGCRHWVLELVLDLCCFGSTSTTTTGLGSFAFHLLHPFRRRRLIIQSPRIDTSSCGCPRLVVLVHFGFCNLNSSFAPPNHARCQKCRRRCLAKQAHFVAAVAAAFAAAVWSVITSSTKPLYGYSRQTSSFKRGNGSSGYYFTVFIATTDLPWYPGLKRIDCLKRPGRENARLSWSSKRSTFLLALAHHMMSFSILATVVTAAVRFVHNSSMFLMGWDRLSHQPIPQAIG